MPPPPYSTPLNLTMQTVATIVLWTLTAVLLVYAARRAMQERTPFPVALVASVAVGSFIEPFYDIGYHLLWHVPGQWTLFTSFELPQPVWVMPAYVVVFGAPALFLYKSFERQGVTAARAFKFGFLTACTTAIFETVAINLGLYSYYGVHPMRLLRYPLWISFMEAAQITGFAISAATLRRRSTSNLHCLALFVIFPANFAFDTLGAGFPAIITINMHEPSMLYVWMAGVASIGLAAAALWWTSQLLLSIPKTPPASAAVAMVTSAARAELERRV